MTEISLFGPCSLDPQSFEALSPALKTEAVRLLAEGGYGVGAIERLTAADRAELVVIGSTRHRLRLTVEDHGGGVSGPRKSTYSATSRLILLQMRDQAGVLAASSSSVAYDLGKSISSVHAALQQLVAANLITMTAPARGKGLPAQYLLTKEGEDLAATLAERPEEEPSDA